MTPFVDLQLLNVFVTNLAIIIATVLSFYFISLKLVTTRKKSHLSFISMDYIASASVPAKLVIGLAFGLASFLLSLNYIPLPVSEGLVDMRYVFIFFTVVYGSELIGAVSTTTLIAFKTISYWSQSGPLLTFEFYNNLIFSLFLLVLVIFLNRQGLTIAQKKWLFLAIFLISRYLVFSFYFTPFWVPSTQVIFLVYALMFSFVFLLTVFTIETAINISQSVHIYRSAAIYDHLTGLYNRESFDFFLDYAVTLPKEGGQEFSLAVLDLNNFKQVNDSYGHPVGDQALVFFSNILKEIKIEHQHYICRIGGDEFAIVHNQSAAEAEQFYDQLFQRLKETPFVYQQRELFLKLSVGLLHVHVTPDFDAADALKRTDTALYQAKLSQTEPQIVTLHA